MLIIGLVVATLFCAYQVMRAERLMLSTIWLAGSSALVALLLYLMGAHEVAVIELSVGAGLVTVLFVFAFSIVGEHTLDAPTIVPRPLVWSVILFTAFVLGWLIFPVQDTGGTVIELPFANVLWEKRALDVLAQIVLIFAGVTGVVGLLSETRPGGKPFGSLMALPHVSDLLLPGEAVSAEIANRPSTNGHEPASEPGLEEVQA
jgi:uncharacterized MnhB-related membrane protein